MRLAPRQVDIICALVAEFTGNDTRIFLFGSRLDDRARGGDVDLLIEPRQPLARLKQAQLKTVLESKLGLPVDLIVTRPGLPGSAFESMVRFQAKPLCTRNENTC